MNEVKQSCFTTCENTISQLTPKKRISLFFVLTFIYNTISQLIQEKRIPLFFVLTFIYNTEQAMIFIVRITRLYICISQMTTHEKMKKTYVSFLCVDYFRLHICLNVAHLHKLPKDIMSDQGSWFISFPQKSRINQHVHMIFSKGQN